MKVKIFRNNILLFCFILGWNILPAQSSFLSEAAEEMPTFQKHYLYPSILRALGGAEGSPIIDLVQELKYVRILRMDSSFIAEQNIELAKLEENLQSEGYEFMGSMYEKGSQGEIYVLEKKGRIEGYIAFQKKEKSSLFIEIVGAIQVKNLTDLMNMDYEVFSMFLE